MNQRGNPLVFRWKRAPRGETRLTSKPCHAFFTNHPLFNGLLRKHSLRTRLGDGFSPAGFPTKTSPEAPKLEYSTVSYVSAAERGALTRDYFVYGDSAEKVDGVSWIDPVINDLVEHPCCGYYGRLPTKNTARNIKTGRRTCVG